MSATTPSDSGNKLEVALQHSVPDINIPPRPAILQRIMVEMDECDPDIEALGKLIGADVGLAAGLIKTALSQVTLVIGSGNSWSQPLLA
jgi:HD-like signal output (HDOD) protein